MIKIEVNESNASEVLKRKQEGENICPICVADALKITLSKVFKVPNIPE